MKERISASVACVLLLCGCSKGPPDLVGTWYSEKASLVTISFYEDGTASFSGTGLLGLRWKFGDSGNRLVKIMALDNKLVMHFKLEARSSNSEGTLSIAGFDTMTWRKKDE